MKMEWTPQENGLREILTLLKESQSPDTATQRAVQQVSFYKIFVYGCKLDLPNALLTKYKCFLTNHFFNPKKLLDRQAWKFSELETSKEFYNVLDEILSDNESFQTDCYSYEEDLDLTQEQSITNPTTIVVHSDDDSCDYDLEDNLPLATFLPVLATSPNLRWSKNVCNFVKIKPFIESSGPHDIPDSVETPLQFFIILFSVKLLAELVFQTNLYTTQKDVNNFHVPTTLEEMECFIGLNILMSLKSLPSYKDFWSSHPEMHDNFITLCMSRNCLSWLLSNIHINNNSVEPQSGQLGYDKLYKLRPMLNRLSETFIKFYKSSRCQSIDEFIIRFKGRISFRQYMPMKPIKRGYKMWVRANESGFVSVFQIYTGKIENVLEQNLGERVVTI